MIKKYTSEKSKKHVNILKILVWITILGVVLYLGYYLFSVFTVKLANRAQTGDTHQNLFSQQMGDTKKVLVVLEDGSQQDPKISGAYLFITNSQKNESILVYLPGWLYFGGLEADFGNSIPVSSFEYAGNYLRKESGIEYAVWQISQMLAIKVDDYIWFTPNGVSEFSNMFGDISKVSSSTKQYYTAQSGDILSDVFFKLDTMSSQYSFLKSVYNSGNLRSFGTEIYSNMSFSQVLSFFASYARTIRNSDTKGIDLSSYNYSTEGTSASGMNIRYVNTDQFDTAYRTLFSNVLDRSIEKERVRVEVYNGSSVSGAAQQFGRKIENAGCDVVRYENAPNVIDKTIVYVSNKTSFQNSLKIVSEILGDNYTLTEGRPDFMTTGDIVVVLGQDIQNMYNF